MAEDPAEPHEHPERDTAEFAAAPLLREPVSMEPPEGQEGSDRDHDGGGDD